LKPLTKKGHRHQEGVVQQLAKRSQVLFYLVKSLNWKKKDAKLKCNLKSFAWNNKDLQVTESETIYEPSPWSSPDVFTG
jgi:hypothetical protein